MRNSNIRRIAAFVVCGTILVFASPPSASAKTRTAAASETASSQNQKAVSVKKSRSRHGVRSARRSSRHSIRSASTKSQGKIAERAAATDTKAATKAKDNAKSMSPIVANANAEMLEGDSETAAATSAPSDNATPDNSEANRYVVKADQMNDIDRAAAGLPAPRPMLVSMESRDDTDVAQTSLIGRIFVAIGGLLTVGSAIRMFIA